MAEATVVAGARRFVHEIEIGKHRLIGDEPIEKGGCDAGPNPYGFLLAALGTCTSATVRMVADRKGIPLHGLEVKLRHEKVSEPAPAGASVDFVRFDRIEREIRLDGPLDDEQRRYLLEIANKCPVHRTLTGEVRIETKLVE
jgi:uncharacterized OsmC-like protein